MKKPFFYKIIAAEFMSEVMQIKNGKHKEWLTNFSVDLVSGEGRTEFTKKIIKEVKEYRENQANYGKKGGKPKHKATLTDPIATLTDPIGSPRVPIGNNISSNKNTLTTPIQGQEELYTTYVDGVLVDPETGEHNPFGYTEDVDQ